MDTAAKPDLATKIFGTMILIMIAGSIVLLINALIDFADRRVAAKALEGYKHCIARGGSVAEIAPGGWNWQCVGIRVPEL